MKNYNNSTSLSSDHGWKKGVISVILIAVFILGVIVYISGNDVNKNISSKGYSSINVKDSATFTSSSPDNVMPITEEDHILGNPNATVKLIEFSDLECPFCKTFHTTMQKVMEKYGKTGEVAWVYRHFPVDQIHSKARIEATASECAEEIGGQDAFWVYITKIFEITPSNDGLDLSLLPKIAEEIGLDKIQFEQCLNSNRYDEHIQNDFIDAVNSGAEGTPYSIIIAPSGEKFSILGSQTYSTIVSVIDIALNKK